MGTVTKMYAVYVSWDAHRPSGRPRYIVLEPEPALLEEHSPFSVTKRVKIPDSHRLSGQCWSDLLLDDALSSRLNVKLRISLRVKLAVTYTPVCVVVRSMQNTVRLPERDVGGSSRRCFEHQSRSSVFTPPSLSAGWTKRLCQW